MNHRVLLAAIVFLSLSAHAAPIMAPEFAADYDIFELGSPTGVPGPFGGLTTMPGDVYTLLLGGGANTASGRLYTVPLIRDVDGHITGFGATTGTFGEVGEYNDGGVVFGPNDVLFTAQWPVNNLGQTLPGSTDEDRVDALGPFGVGGVSISGINFIPTGFAGAGGMRVVSWADGNWYDVSYAPDGSGTFDITGAVQVDLDLALAGIQSLPGGPEGFVYIEAGNAGFATDSLLVSDFSLGQISAYDLDGSGNPLLATRRDFLTGLDGAEGAFIDPVTGDFLFSTFGGSDHIVRVEGFLAPPPIISVPEPGSLALFGLGLAGMGLMRRRRKV